MKSTRDQEGGLEAILECLTLKPLHLGQEAGRTFRRNFGGVGVPAWQVSRL